MKQRFLGIATATMMLTGGSFFAFAGNGQSNDCPLKGTPDCPLVKTMDIKKEKAAEATTKVTVAATGVPPCCNKEVSLTITGNETQRSFDKESLLHQPNLHATLNYARRYVDSNREEDIL